MVVRAENEFDVESVSELRVYDVWHCWISKAKTSRATNIIDKYSGSGKYLKNVLFGIDKIARSSCENCHRHLNLF